MIFIKFFIEFGQLFEKFSPCDMLGENGQFTGTPCICGKIILNMKITFYFFDSGIYEGHFSFCKTNLWFNVGANI